MPSDHDLPYISFHYAKKVWDKSVHDQLPIVIWKLPGIKESSILIQSEQKDSYTTIDIERLPPGFVIQPFVGQFIFLEGGFIAKINDTPIKHETYATNYKKTEVINLENDKTNFIYAINKAKTSITKKEFEKVVLSRTIEIILPDTFNVIESFQRLCESYPASFVSAFYIPKSDVIWLGATPEILLSVNKNDLYTMALAGTLPVNTIWTEKEYKEQELVSEYIDQCFRKAGHTNYMKTGPISMNVGRISHLRTDFFAKPGNFSLEKLANAMIKLLHPTPAVCGTPLAEALDFILKTENQSRNLYCGYIGPVNIQAATQLFVNLRTMCIKGASGTLYVGCGITADSIPEKEFIESEMKSRTLLDVI